MFRVSFLAKCSILWHHFEIYILFIIHYTLFTSTERRITRQGSPSRQKTTYLMALVLATSRCLLKLKPTSISLTKSAIIRNFSQLRFPSRTLRPISFFLRSYVLGSQISFSTFSKASKDKESDAGVEKQLSKREILTLEKSIEKQRERICGLKNTPMHQKHVSRLTEVEGILNELSTRDDTYASKNSSKDTQLVQLLREVATLRLKLEAFDELEKGLQSASELLELARGNESDHQDEKILLTKDEEDCLLECKKELEQLESKISVKELTDLMTGPYDHLPAYVQILAGSGGTESCDWAMMLCNMYKGWVESAAENVGTAGDVLSSKIVDEQIDQNSNGYRSVTMLISGHNAYGMLKAEAGVHRLVRISPFDPSQKRHTSFAQILVYPKIHFSSSNAASQDGDSDRFTTPSIPIINPSDLRIDTYRASGAGGQHVNKTDSAVRITHLPSGIVVGCQNERSQHQNKAVAMSMLQSKLVQLEQEKQKKVKEDLTVGGGGENSFGNQIRSYVLHPYKIVKDARTGWESARVDDFLKGDFLLLNDAMITFLTHQRDEGA